MIHCLEHNLSVSFKRLPWTPRCHTRALLTFVVIMTSLMMSMGEIHPSQARPPGASPNELISPNQLSRLDDFIEELMQCRGVPGLTLSVVVGDQMTLTRQYGHADIENNVKVDDSTVFCVSSLTKAFTSILLAILLNRQGYTWDTKVRHILGDQFQMYNDYVTDHVTIRDLLLHRTGVPRYDLLWFSGKMDKQQLFRHLRCLKPTDEFRSKVIYNNIMYMVAGHVAEVLGGRRWEELMMKEILDPLGMTNSAFFHDRGDLADKFAKQYVNYNGEQVELDNRKFRKGTEAIGPAITLCTTASDMTYWMEFILYKGTYSGRLKYTDVMEEVLTSQVLATNVYYSEIQRPRTPVSFTLNTYGLGWLGGYYRGYPLLSHFGSFPGYFSKITLLRIYNIGIFSSINGGNQDLPYTINSLIHTYILDLLLGETPWIESGLYQDRSKEACFFPHDQYIDFSAIPDVNTSVTYWSSPHVYVGTYVSPIYADLEVWIDQKSTVDATRNNMTLRMRYGQLTFTLYPQQRHNGVDKFIAVANLKDWRIAPIQVDFTLSIDGGDIYCENVNLPEFEMKSGGNIFSRIDAYNTSSYSCDGEQSFHHATTEHSSTTKYHSIAARREESPYHVMCAILVLLANIGQNIV